MSDFGDISDPDELSTISPKRKNPKGKDILMKSPGIKYEDIVNNLSEASGLGRETISKTIAEYKRTNTVTSPNKKRIKSSLFDKIDDLDRNGLRQKYTIKKLDFVFEKRKRCSVLTKREDLIVQRRSYLYNIRKYRQEGRQIYYLDETCLNAGDFVDRVWKDNTVLSKHDAFNKGLTTGSTNPTGKGKRLMILHIGSDKGFLPGGLLCFESKKNSADYHDEINGDNFKEWFETILPRLEPNNIIVMDNAPYHSVILEKYPSTRWNKAQLSEWLQSKGVVLDRPFLKHELMAQKEAGHTVLRLPPYHCEFNPIELAWAMVKGYAKRENTTFKMDDVRQLLHMAIERVTSENWQNFIKHVIGEEEKIWKVDDIMDEVIDQMEHCVLTITGETDSDYE
ncbi:uncharacterized protein LOC103308943 [Acyrthosiphon pisum]|uniref:Tc1-like transposase DDE domain-containing protein n=1 Tax=Acyrthosiphon pisum TaxID=7029 RepID=A0A8R2F703_ACYPI|nr:uncharacterized protein LOC103308943 [Acyrthosiphon pisum]|eukprot:XP_008181478.1 PREDICTED: uncharacterized protein LOC103308943 [Acyrthosiphon pisum]